MSVSFYAVLGGADFGGGFWDLVAGGDRRGMASRKLIDQSITPVWEANHMWLIFSLVIFWTVFPQGLRRRHDRGGAADLARGLWHRAARLRLRLSKGGRDPSTPAAPRGDLCPLLARDAILYGHRDRRHRRGQRSRTSTRRTWPRGRAPHRSTWAFSSWRSVPTWPRSCSTMRPSAAATTACAATLRCAPRSRRSSQGCCRSRPCSRCASPTLPSTTASRIERCPSSWWRAPADWLRSPSS